MSSLENTEKSLPDLHQSELDKATLEALFRDLSSCTKILAVIPKASHGHIVPENISLDKGRELLVGNQLRGLQIRYLYNGSEWWDTLIKTVKGVRITRIKQ